ncbi:MAG: tetratricopeptide repeat protein [Proteobacteria bacterium]|nr:tetratricopeptide repeat protein [Pseudomonadota bacterium]
MSARLTLSCRTILFILIIFLTAPCAFAAEAEIQPASEVESSEANEEAIEKLRRMSPEEIKALDKKLAEALILYYDRNFARALPIFKEIAGRVETMDIMFWIGTSAMEIGKTELAIQKFQKMLSIDPKLHRVRLELAATYFKTGRYKEARRELEVVQAAAPPPGVQKNIENLLAAIEERTKKVFWNARASQGVLVDDNVSAGPDDRDILWNGAILTVDEKSAKLRDEASVTTAMGNILYDIGEKNELMWNTTASFYNLAYFHYSEFNYMAVDITTGPWWAGRRAILKVPFGHTEAEYASDRLSHTYHMDPNYEYYFSQYFSLKGLYSYGDTAYYPRRNSGLNNIRHRFELTPSIYLADRKHILSATTGYENSNADADKDSYHGIYYAFSYFTRFPTNTEFFLRYQWTRKKYDGKALPGYNWDRIDQRDGFIAVLSQEFLEYFFTSFAFNYTDNQSNCELYDFDRITYTINVGCKF